MLSLWLLVSSYSLFVFISESFNPFVPSKSNHKKPHKRLGIAAAYASIVSGLVAIGLMYVGIDERSALVVYLVLTWVFLVPSLIRFKRDRILL